MRNVLKSTIAGVILLGASSAFAGEPVPLTGPQMDGVTAGAFNINRVVQITIKRASGPGAVATATNSVTVIQSN